MNKRKSFDEIVFHPISPYYTKYDRVGVERNGVLSDSHQFIEYAVIDKIQSVEFSLGNLVAIGAANSLSYVSMSVNSDMNFVDEFAKSYQSVTHVEEASKS